MYNKNAYIFYIILFGERDTIHRHADNIKIFIEIKNKISKY